MFDLPSHDATHAKEVVRSGLQHCSSFASVISDTTVASSNATCYDLIEDQDAAERLMARPQSGLTTVMVQNVPVSFSRSDLIELIRGLGFGASVDLVYLPFHVHRSVNKGFAFLDFVTAEAAGRFREQMDGYVMPHGRRGKRLGVKPARVQGLGENVAQFRNSGVMAAEVPEEYKPVLVDDLTGTIVSFPGATRRLRPSHIKKKMLSAPPGLPPPVGHAA
mmetsp:Transcript_91056/g.243762  ORF Transcript_91056/g.243762 Transcript_91056/m.243762 type:complete len:220 (-) Transcript_91056:102-761(-)